MSVPGDSVDPALALAERRLRAVDMVRAEEDALGELLSDIGDDVRAAVHFQCAAHMRRALALLGDSAVYDQCPAPSWDHAS